MTEKGSSIKALRELIVKRSSIKGQITKFRNYLGQVKDKGLMSNIELVELNLKLTKFESLSVKFDNLQSEIEVINSESIDAEVDERDSIEHDIISCIAMAKTIINDHNIDNKDQPQCLHDHSELGIRLPQIQIEKFSGQYFRWLQFHDTYESLIHNNNRITPIQKFHYLSSYLEGDAARLISNLEVSSANYSKAWSLICERYNNKRALINHHLKSLFSIQAITRESDRSLRFLVDQVNKDLRALTSLDQPTDKWDILLIYMLSSKLDSQTLIKWEEHRNSLDDIPTLELFNKFLNDRADVLESLNRNKGDNSINKGLPSTSGSYNNHNKNIMNKNKHNNKNNQNINYTKTFAVTNQRPYRHYCVICNDDHKIYDCPVFKSKNIQERLSEVSKYKLCVNCLRQGHPVSDCRMKPCHCNKKHNSLLHDPEKEVKCNVVTNDAEFAMCFFNRSYGQALLPTAVIEVSNPITNKTTRVRALLDCGSQSSFITRSLIKKLSLNTNSIDALRVVGIGDNSLNNVIETCTVKLSSINNSYNLKLTCMVLDKIVGDISKSHINLKNLNLPQKLPLADPQFYCPGSIDLLIGSDMFWDIIGDKTRCIGDGKIKLRSSKFGWIVCGSLPSYYNNNNYKSAQCNLVLTKLSPNDIDLTILPKFWEIEDLPKRPLLSWSEEACEKHFVENTYRLKSGRFCVKLPLLDTPDCLGDTYKAAKFRLMKLEKRFKRNPSLKLEYTNFINEYAELGHLTESKITKPCNSYFLCHHPVLKQNSESTRLRVVFDGSASSSSGYSLNDILMVGPNMQDNLFSILIRSRQYKFLLCGDIEKMYRQVDVHDDNRDLQLILWRENENKPIRTLRLNTVTYGTSSASFLSTRCLWQLGEEQEDVLIKKIIQRDFYVDDLITGSDDELQLRYIKSSVTEALRHGCFNLRKFKCNLPSIFENDFENTQENLIISESSSTLGLGWNPLNDTLHFPFENISINDNITKRSILSNSFKIFDPLGILSPCIIQPKLILQRMWKIKVHWDELAPIDIQRDWQRFVQNLKHLKDFKLQRLVLINSPEVIELHSFSDSSESAYGACIYMRSINVDGQIFVRLLCSKSRVAPLRSMTIPRLELCAALLAARLTASVLESLRYKPTAIYHWCDSSVVISWINSDISKLKTFVANRVGEILENTKAESWRYVNTKSNPADLISRGVDAGKLLKMDLWWSGPDFLSKNEAEWPNLNNKNIVTFDLPEIKSNTLILTSLDIDFERFSKLDKIIRSFAYVNRFINNLRNKNVKNKNILSLDELNKSFSLLCIVAQKQSFPIEYDLLLKGKDLSSKSKLLSFSPFLDEDKVIRVGGRLDSSNYSFEKKHPILLHSSHHLTKLYFEKEHFKNMHAGPQLLLASVRETVWAIGGRQLARRTVNRCIVCRRVRGTTLNPKMGILPAQRVNTDFPFLSVGIDFAGPFYIVNRKGRGSRLLKCYMCLFICLRYKCIHLEAVSDLSKDSFIMTLKRFISRRGRPAEIFCDNGRNFVAAAKELTNFLKHNEDSFIHFANQENIKFNFTPTYAPHFGGIWEAGVKSAKFHLRRVVGNCHLTFEEILTLFAQVESILNSRPLYPLSSSPDDFLSLTPGHFLIGRALNALPSKPLDNIKETNLRRYEKLEKIRQHFWNRWQKEYVAELQQRTKWKTNLGKLKIGDLVLLQEDHAPPLKWRLGRVKRLFPGPDNISRVADIDTLRGCVRRPLVRLCPLLADEELHS